MFLVSEMGSYHVAQVDPDLLGSGGSPASAYRVQGLQACSTTLGFCIFHLVLVISALLASLPRVLFFPGHQLVSTADCWQNEMMPFE